MVFGFWITGRKVISGEMMRRDEQALHEVCGRGKGHGVERFVEYLQTR